LEVQGPNHKMCLTIGIKVKSDMILNGKTNSNWGQNDVVFILSETVHFSWGKTCYEDSKQTTSFYSLNLKIFWVENGWISCYLQA